MPSVLTSNQAARLAGIALANVTREFPNKLDHVLTGPQDLRGPRHLHPIFYGSFDWHSSVHSHWVLVRIFRRFASLHDRIQSVLDQHFTLITSLPRSRTSKIRSGARSNAPMGWRGF